MMAMNEQSVEGNPLLDWEIVPDYEAIEPKHVEPAVRQVLAGAEETLTRIEGEKPASWDDFMPELERVGDAVQRVWGVVSHLNSVRNTPELREAYQKMQGEVVKFYNRYGQSRPLYEAYIALKESAAWGEYDEGQRRILTQAIRQAELAGVALDGEARERFNGLSERLAALGNEFSNHVLDATKGFALVLTMAEETAGLPTSYLAMAAQAARQAGDEGATAEAGPWRVTLDYPSYIGFMKNSTRRDLRERLYLAYVGRASEGELDNKPLVEEILQARAEQAEILEFETFADMNMTRKMAPSVAAVEKLLVALREAAKPAGERDLAQLVSAARGVGAPEAEEFRPWDTHYWTERVREAQYALSDEELRPYFPLPVVLQGMFDLITELFGVTFGEDTDSVPRWHEDVQYFRVYDEAGVEISSFYLDPYSRPAEKRGGAWMDVLVTRSVVMARGDAAVRLPIAYMICNQTPPVDGKPSLMTFPEVVTLFHEFGHVLHHILTRVDYGQVAGVAGVEWDAVELPSQFVESWCYHRPTLKRMSRHYETGEALPDELIERMMESRTYQQGYATLRQVTFGLFDMALHTHYDGGETVREVQQRISGETQVIQPVEEDCFYCGFGHIFAGGYAAGYYSYKWAEVLSADAYGAFLEAEADESVSLAGLGRRFRETVLAEGGARHPMALFVAFRGREPELRPLLEQSGLLTV